MDASSGQLQEMQNHSLENVLESSKTQQQDRKPIKPEPEQALKCPRCESTNTKFCYYNNYSLSQPRYFCKSCRRYWTKGGTLRNVPVGGGCRKNKRSSSSSQKAYQSFENNPSNPLTGLQTLGLGYDHSNDLALAFARLQQRQSQDHDPLSAFGHQYNNTTTTQCNDILGNHNVHTHTGFFDALRSGYMDNQNGFRNLYNLGDVDSSSAEILLPSDQEFSNSVATMKQEICDVGRGHHDNRVLYGFPWQLNAAGDGNMSQDVAASSWHGLVNSPLM